MSLIAGAPLVCTCLPLFRLVIKRGFRMDLNDCVDCGADNARSKCECCRKPICDACEWVIKGPDDIVCCDCWEADHDHARWNAMRGIYGG